MSGPRIAVCSWSLAPDGVDGLLAALETLGIDAVQLALSPLVREPDRWPSGPGSIANRLRAGGIEIVSGMMAMAGEDYSTLETIALTGGVRPDETWPENRAHASAVADVAADEGVGLVTFHAGFLPESADDPQREAILARLRVVADAFAEHDVDLALETGQETAATLEIALADLDHPNVGVNFDPANMILYGKGDPVDALRTLAPSVRQVHLKDAVPTDVPGTWGTEKPAGDGAVDWPAFFEVALSLDPTPDFVIEREAGATRIEDIAKARDLVAGFVSS